MSRSYGDLAAESVGVFAEPEITETVLGAEDRFLIFASDGVWEFITSQEACDLVAPFLEDDPQARTAHSKHKQQQSVMVARSLGVPPGTGFDSSTSSDLASDLFPFPPTCFYFLPGRPRATRSWTRACGGGTSRRTWSTTPRA